MKNVSNPKKATPPKKRTAATLPAKITPPQLDKCYLRKNLFHLLDQSGNKPAVWISGPVGSGKTMLAASYLRQRKISSLWYQVDARDKDPATLFYYLGLAAKRHAPGRRKPLPQLPPEYLGGLSAFAQNFFEALFERFTPPFALVIDNYQELAEKDRLHEIVPDLLAVVPDGCQVILISRSQPPQPLGRFQVHQRMALLNWQEMQLSVKEVQALSGVIQKTPLSQAEATSMHAITQGWAAGVVLVLAQPKMDAEPIDIASLAVPETVFDCFATEILAKLDKGTRDFLIQSAFLPQFSASVATALTGNKQADNILADLVRKNFFTLQHSGQKPPLYQYHPLFKAFLQQKACSELSPSQLKTLQHRAAKLLIETGHYDEAAELMRTAEHFDHLADLISTQAQHLVAQGRLETLQEWLQALPEKIFIQRPWLSYWLGICRLPFAPGQSQHHFEQALTGFKSQQDTKGIYLSLAGIFKAIIYHQTDFRQMDYWIKELEGIQKEFGKAPSEEIEAKLLTGLLTHFTASAIRYKPFYSWAQRADTLWRQMTDKSLRLELGSFLIEYHGFIGHSPQDMRMVNEMIQLAASDDVHPYTAVLALMRIEYYYWQLGHYQQALEYADKAQEIARTSGIHFFDSMIWARKVYALLCSGNIEKADDLIKEMKQRLTPESQDVDKAYYNYTLAWRKLLQGEIDQAIKILGPLSEFIRGKGAVVEDYLCHQGLALALCAKGRIKNAQDTLKQAYTNVAHLKLFWVDYQYFLLQAYFDLKSNRQQTGLKNLSRALALGKKHKFSQIIFWQPKVMAFLYTQALEKNIEVNYVRKMIRRFNILPSRMPMKIRNWPWPIRIFTLGRFEVRVDGQVLASQRRKQNKPLSLLKAIITFGGRNVSEEKLCDALWPDADGDAAHIAFTTTLHRLRKLIGHDQAITLRDRRVNLDPRLCWVDTWQLEKLLSHNDLQVHTSTDTADLPQTAKQIFKIYKGPFLPANDSSWLLLFRDDLHTQVLQQINTMATHCQAKKSWQQAITIYERGLEIDPLAESFYPGLMQCYQKMDRRADALAVYERCSKIMGEVLDIEPSADMETMCAQLRS